MAIRVRYLVSSKRVRGKVSYVVVREGTRQRVVARFTTLKAARKRRSDLVGKLRR